MVDVMRQQPEVQKRRKDRNQNENKDKNHDPLRVLRKRTGIRERAVASVVGMRIVYSQIAKRKPPYQKRIGISQNTRSRPMTVNLPRMVSRKPVEKQVRP